MRLDTLSPEHAALVSTDWGAPARSAAFELLRGQTLDGLACLARDLQTWSTARSVRTLDGGGLCRAINGNEVRRLAR